MLQSKWLKMAVAAVVVFVPATLLRADLDDEETPTVTPAPEPISPPSEKPKPKSDKPGTTTKPTPPAPPAPAKSGSAPIAPGATKKSPASSSNSVKKTRTTPGEDEDRKQPVKWKSKGLRATKEKGVMELSEDVVVTQGELQLKANHAKVFYDDKLDEVSKVVVTGNVKINKNSADPKERISGAGNEGVFYNSERKVILRGNAQLIRGDDVLRGKQITYELDTGWISVDNVEGVMQPGDKKQ